MVQTELPFKRAKTKITQKDRILEYLIRQTVPLAIHEMLIGGVSQNSMGTRLPELAKIGKVRGTKDVKEPFKRWEIVREGQ